MRTNITLNVKIFWFINRNSLNMSLIHPSRILYCAKIFTARFPKVRHDALPGHKTHYSRSTRQYLKEIGSEVFFCGLENENTLNTLFFQLSILSNK